MTFEISDARTELSPIITKEFIENKERVLVLDSIAGCAKSSTMFRLLDEMNSDFIWLVATNLLKFSAIEKYSKINPNIKICTIASGLFTNKGSHFYIDFKEPECDVIVLDEIMLTNKKVFDYIAKYIGQYKFVVLTDHNQMTGASDSEAIQMKYALKQLLESDTTDVIHIKETLRARDEETRQIYHEFYDIADSDIVFHFEDLKVRFPVIKFDDMPYLEDAGYICHTKKEELLTYLKFQFNQMPNLKKVPKGLFASRPPKNLDNYPILPQIEAEKKGAPKCYCQPYNVGTTYRYEGGECPGLLFYEVSKNCAITARELYTTISRIHHISNFIVVLCDDSSIPKPLKTFMNIPVKHEEYLRVDHDDNTIPCSQEELDEIFKDYPDTEDIYYNKTLIYAKDSRRRVAYVLNGRKPSKSIFRINGNDIMKGGTQTQRTLISMCKRTGSLAHTYTPQIYKILEKNGIDKIKIPRVLGSKTKHNYEIDATLAYVFIMAYEKMPAEGILSTEYSDDMLNYYIYHGNKYTDGSVVDEDLKTEIELNHQGTCTYAFSTPYTQGCYVGKELVAKGMRSQEDHDEVKDIMRKAGCLEWHYIEKRYDDTLNDCCYVVDEKKNYELFIATVFSKLTAHMLRLQRAMKENGYNAPRIQVDAVKFDNLDDLEKVGKIVDSVLPDWFCWKVNRYYDANNHPTLLQNFAPFKSREEYDKEKNKERCKKYQAKKKSEMTEEELAEKKRKDAERAKAYRARKKAEKEANNS